MVFGRLYRASKDFEWFCWYNWALLWRLISFLSGFKFRSYSLLWSFCVHYGGLELPHHGCPNANPILTDLSSYWNLVYFILILSFDLLTWRVQCQTSFGSWLTFLSKFLEEYLVSMSSSQFVRFWIYWAAQFVTKACNLVVSSFSLTMHLCQIGYLPKLK